MFSRGLRQGATTGATERRASALLKGVGREPIMTVAFRLTRSEDSVDFFAHGLWAGAAGAAANLKLKNKLRFFHTVIWGVFPDAFAFLPMAVVLLWFRFFGEPISPRLLFSRALRQALPRFLWPEELYQFSHSLLVFLAVFFAVRLLFRRPVQALLAWPLHILLDIPTHGAGVYRTPFLWPLSSYRFSGIWWSRRWLMILNYSLIAAVYVALFVSSFASRRQPRAPDKSVVPQ